MNVFGAADVWLTLHLRVFLSVKRSVSSSIICPVDAPSDSVQAEREREEWDREQQGGGGRARPRTQRSVSKERWVETMVVADSKLIEYHGSDNVESYIFTIMNMVRVEGLFTPSQLFQSTDGELRPNRSLESSMTPALGMPSTSSWSGSFCCMEKR